jgi:hypothetical protein
MLGAGVGAGFAKTAAVGGVEDVGLERLAFRVMAPPTGERATFEKDRGANAGTVVDGKSHDIENEGGLSVSDHRDLYSEITISGCAERCNGMKELLDLCTEISCY